MNKSMQMKNCYIKDTKYVTFNPSELAKNINLCKHMVFFYLHHVTSV